MEVVERVSLHFRLILMEFTAVIAFNQFIVEILSSFEFELA